MGMATMPAGTEIRVRTAGTRRPNRVACQPWRSNHSEATSTSRGDRVITRPKRPASFFSRALPKK
ncbi:hypothetical protein D3C78_1878730 [compost metagenome]